MSNLQLALPGVLATELVDEWVWSEDFNEVIDVKRFEHATVMRDEVVRAIARGPAGRTSTRRSVRAGTPSPSWRPSRRRASSASIAIPRRRPPPKSDSPS